MAKQDAATMASAPTSNARLARTASTIAPIGICVTNPATLPKAKAKAIEPSSQPCAAIK